MWGGGSVVSLPQGIFTYMADYLDEVRASVNSTLEKSQKPYGWLSKTELNRKKNLHSTRKSP